MAEQDKKLVSKSVFAGKLPWIVAVVFFAGIGVFLLLGGVSDSSSGGSHNSLEEFTVRRDNLLISVTESGDIEALNSKDIKSKVEGRATIITIVDEGTYITEEDVNNGKVLVELDSSQIKEKLVQREISYLNTEAGFTDAKESLEIQKKQNESDIKGGQLKLKFALMDFQKYVGQVVAEDVYKQITDDDADLVIDMTGLLEHPDLGGEALQKLRELGSDIDLSKEELVQAESTLEWTKKLYEKEYVSRSDLEADELNKNRREVSLEKAYTAKELFVEYGFPKESEKLLSDYQEAERELERIEARARSELAQAEAKLKSSEASFLVQKERLEKMQKQLEACTIRAPAPGQVVYASSMGSGRRRSNLIEVGAGVNERERIISIPDMSVMKVEIKVHEVWIDKVQPGQKGEITIVAFPDRPFTGEVLKKAPLADRQRWFNPDLKVYVTDVRIDGTHEYLKTGMSAKVKILMDEKKNVLIVPIQTVINQEGRKVCYVSKDNRVQRREVETGAFNNDFVEIKSGLSEGDKVLLNPPRLAESGAEQED